MSQGSMCIKDDNICKIIGLLINMITSTLLLLLSGFSIFKANQPYVQRPFSPSKTTTPKVGCMVLEAVLPIRKKNNVKRATSTSWLLHLQFLSVIATFTCRGPRGLMVNLHTPLPSCPVFLKLQVEKNPLVMSMYQVMISTLLSKNGMESQVRKKSEVHQK